MGTKGTQTKDRLMDIAEQLILQQGFAATSIEEIINAAGITKSGFFYHFDGKNELAVALMERYQETDRLLFGGLFKRARELSDDPLQQMLIFIKLLSETMSDLEGLHPGCLVASFTYESHKVNDQVRAITAACVMDWRQQFKEQLDQIDEHYTANAQTSSRELADMLSTIIEGGIIVSRAMNNPSILVEQLLQYRAYIGLLYQ